MTSKFPFKMIAWTLTLAFLLAMLHWQSQLLNDRFNLDPSFAWLVTYALAFVMFITWLVWAFFVAKQRLLGLAFILTPILISVFYIPIIGGDINIIGFHPRFWTAETDYVIPSGTELASVDVRTTTPHDFDQFLGPDRNARVDGVTLSGSWKIPPVQLWKIDIGEGWSGFVVVNGFAITQEQRGEYECVTCYDVETGELKWIHQSKRRHEDFEGMGKVGPRATPTIHEGLVYASGGTGVLDCLDGRTGELVWSVDIPDCVGITLSHYTNSQGYAYTMEQSALRWGRSPSPLIVDDLVVISAGGPLDSNSVNGPDPTATLIAFDKKTGQEKWRGGKRMISYGSPSLATLDGHRQILLVTESDAVGFDPKTGEELWSHRRPGKSNQDANCSQVTVVDDRRVILSKGYGLGGELVEISNTGGEWTARSIRLDPRILKTKLTNPVIYQNHAYSLSDGFLECIEVDSFHRKWKQRGNFGNGQILLVGNKLLVHSETSSTLSLVDADPAHFTLRGSIETVDGIGWNTLCLYGDLLLVRTDRQAACFRLPTE